MVLSSSWRLRTPLKSYMMDKPFVDGGGLCSPGRGSTCTRLVKPIGAQCFSSLQAMLDKHMDGHRFLLELACKKHADQPFPATLVKKARETIKCTLRNHGAQLDLDAVPERHPFRLALLEAFLHLCSDPDVSAYFSGKDSFAAGVFLGLNQKMPRTLAVFERKCKWRSYDGETAAAEVSGPTTQMPLKMRR